MMTISVMMREMGCRARLSAATRSIGEFAESEGDAG